MEEMMRLRTSFGTLSNALGLRVPEVMAVENFRRTQPSTTPTNDGSPVSRLLQHAGFDWPKYLIGTTRKTVLTRGPTQANIKIVDIIMLSKRCLCHSIEFEVEESDIINVVCACGACRIVHPSQYAEPDMVRMEGQTPRTRFFH
jgi:hypothetical protein